MSTQATSTYKSRYAEFLSRKRQLVKPSGFKVERESLNANLFDWQADIVRWAASSEDSDLDDI